MLLVVIVTVFMDDIVVSSSHRVLVLTNYAVDVVVPIRMATMVATSLIPSDYVGVNLVSTSYAVSDVDLNVILIKNIVREPYVLSLVDSSMRVDSYANNVVVVLSIVSIVAYLYPSIVDYFIAV